METTLQQQIRYEAIKTDTCMLCGIKCDSESGYRCYQLQELCIICYSYKLAGLKQINKNPSYRSAQNARARVNGMLKPKDVFAYERSILTLKDRVEELAGYQKRISDYYDEDDKKRQEYERSLRSHLDRNDALSQEVDRLNKKIDSMIIASPHLELMVNSKLEQAMKNLKKAKTPKHKIEAYKKKKNKTQITNIYFIQAETGKGPVKIGKANDVQSRLGSIQTGHPEKLTVVHTIEGVPIQVEQDLHKRFEAYRVRGEWFTEDVIRFIKTA